MDGAYLTNMYTFYMRCTHYCSHSIILQNTYTHARTLIWIVKFHSQQIGITARKIAHFDVYMHSKRWKAWVWTLVRSLMWSVDLKINSITYNLNSVQLVKLEHPPKHEIDRDSKCQSIKPENSGRSNEVSTGIYRK